MKYVSLDLETTSLQPSPDHILMLSMVVEDSAHPEIPVEQLPHFTCFVKHPRIEGEAYALGMNGWILDFISGRAKNPPYPVYGAKSPCELTDTGYINTWLEHALIFLGTHFGPDRITVAGKNVAGFDLQFLPSELKKRFRHKVLDPGPVLVRWAMDDQVPNFDQCKTRCGITTPVAHDAREDAMDVIRCLRTFY